jgi:hypothetical protein
MSETPPKEPIEVSAALVQMTDFLSSLAWQKLGLQPDMATGQIHPDLTQAKLAIDATAAIAGLIEPLVDGEDRRQLQNLVRDLRVNYVEKAKGL